MDKLSLAGGEIVGLDKQLEALKKSAETAFLFEPTPVRTTSLSHQYGGEGWDNDAFAAAFKMKKCKDITMETDVGNELRLHGVIGIVDGMNVQKIRANRLPTGFEFMVAHPCATVAPVKLEDFNIHNNPPGISGTLVEGRVVYDAFVLENKAKGIYYYGQPITAPTPEEPGGEG